jgi:hypothetical protein
VTPPPVDFAAEVTRVAEELAELEGLDFSKESLSALEGALTRKSDLDFARAAGAYLAEVILRRSPVKLRWVEAKRGGCGVRPRAVQWRKSCSPPGARASRAVTQQRSAAALLRRDDRCGNGST